MAGSQKVRSDERDRESLARNERLRRARLNTDVRRSGGGLLEEAMRLSAFAVELGSAPRRARG